MAEFLGKLPCLSCGKPSETVVMRENKHGLPSCADGGCMFKICEERADLERFAYELQLLAGDEWTATNKILYAREKLFHG
jgi:hypothetical protein